VGRRTYDDEVRLLVVEELGCDICGFDICDYAEAIFCFSVVVVGEYGDVEFVLGVEAEERF